MVNDEKILSRFYCLADKAKLLRRAVIIFEYYSSLLLLLFSLESGWFPTMNLGF